MRGNPQPFKALCSHADDVTIIERLGWGREGMERAESRNSMTGHRRVLPLTTMSAASKISPPSSHRKWRGPQLILKHTKIRLAGTQEVKPIASSSNRCIFRQEDGQWKLVHRHADPLSSRCSRQPQSFGIRIDTHRTGTTPVEPRFMSAIGTKQDMALVHRACPLLTPRADIGPFPVCWFSRYDGWS